MTDTRTGFLVVCVHSTRRTRAQASPGCHETRCHGCRATVLMNPVTVEYARRRGAELYPLCPTCTIATAGPDELVGDAESPPETAAMLEADGHPDGAALIAEQAGMTIRRFAYNALRHTIGGEG